MKKRSFEEESKVKNVGIWIRVSTEDQARGESPEHHEKHARFYAEPKGWQIQEVYHLEAVSGKSVMEHPETQRVLHEKCYEESSAEPLGDDTGSSTPAI